MSVLPLQRIAIGTRGSALARAQSDWVAGRLGDLWPGLAMDVRAVETEGDRDQLSPLAGIGGQGVFVKDLERAILSGGIDAAVHSLKDVPSDLPNGLGILCVPLRADPRDCLVLPDAQPGRSADSGEAIEEIDRLPLPAGARVGTSSRRRAAQLRALRPDLEIREVRGNVDTRLRKLDAGGYDALVLASAGLDRLRRGDRARLRLSPSVCVPAVAQGALGIEGRSDRPELVALLAPLGDHDATMAVTAERALLQSMGAGCTVPLGACATIRGVTIRIIAFVGRPDGTGAVRVEMEGPVADAASLGRAAAGALKLQGAEAILHEIS